MLVTMFVSLYTARVVLNSLGVSDFGLYNVIGGVITMLGFITSAMASASERFLAYDIGKKDFIKLNKTFNTTITIYFIFIVITILVAETLGLWFVKNKLNIPSDREHAAFWVYQFSVLAFIVSLIRIPFNSAIIAFEKMNFYAWISILEVVLKLLIIYLLVFFNFDKLILYSILTFSVIGIITFTYYLYSLKIFPTFKFRMHWDKPLFLSMFKFAGWNMYGASSYIGYTQGINILLNIFFNPAINAARGIAFQINSQIFSFVNNFQVAVGPQLIKYYSAREFDSMKKLYYQSSRLSYYLFFIFALPAFLEINLLLKWWLKIIPDYTVLFARLVILESLIYCMAGTLIHVVQASGKNKFYELGVGTLMLLNLPISYVLLKLGYAPQITMIVSNIISFILVFFKLFYMKLILNFSILEYIKQVIIKNIIITLLTIIIPVYLYFNLEENFYNFIFICFSCVIISVLNIYFIGLNRNEKLLILNFIKAKLK